MPPIVAFLDVLGFSSYTEQDLSGAQLLLRHQEFILRQKIDDGHLHPISDFTDPQLAAVHEAHLVHSFKYFLPFSDSVFIVSENSDCFARQLSHFLMDCLQLVGHVYNCAADPACPEGVAVTDYPSGKKRAEKWYPPIWRGGLATGDLSVFNVTGIDNGRPIQIPNLAGSAVVKAVRAERLGKCRGPRLLCEVGFEQNFGPKIRQYFRPVTGTVSELLWPAFIYNADGNLQAEMQKFHRLWAPVVALWRSKRGQAVFEHYDEFLKLLVRSLLCWADIVGCGNEAREKVLKLIHHDLSEHLVEGYLS
jgi:hypothetical protein